MSWALVKELQLTDYWQYTEPVEGEYFRVQWVNPPVNPRMMVAQARTSPTTEIFDARKLTSAVDHILDFLQPSFWSERRIAVRKSPLSPGWTVRIEVSDIPIVHAEQRAYQLFLPETTAAIDLSALRVLREVEEGLLYASSDDALQAFQVVGLSLKAVEQGNRTSPLIQGRVSDSGWNWQPGQPIYLGIAGMMSQSAPAIGFILQVGTAKSPTEIDFEIQEPWFL
ncbi:MAG TPA: hypothetical protein V6D10_05760 [Trichocoleus sp.]|jgi:hypothetical protein